jgi:hypothetical protein
VRVSTSFSCLKIRFVCGLSENGNETAGYIYLFIYICSLFNEASSVAQAMRRMKGR